MSVQDLAGYRFGQDVGGIAITLHFKQSEIAAAQSLLDPQLAHSQVAHSPNAASPAYADGRGGVGVHSDGHGEAEVAPPCLNAEGLNGALHQSFKLGLCGT